MARGVLLYLVAWGVHSSRYHQNNWFWFERWETLGNYHQGCPRGRSSKVTLARQGCWPVIFTGPENQAAQVPRSISWFSRKTVRWTWEAANGHKDHLSVLFSGKDVSNCRIRDSGRSASILSGDRNRYQPSMAEVGCQYGNYHCWQTSLHRLGTTLKLMY